MIRTLSRVVWIVAGAKLVLHLVSSARGYGFFGDELYYMACAAHPAFGYVDHPPLSIWLLGGWQALFGDSLAALRVLPALIGSVSVIVAGQLARELGGRAGAQTLTALVVALAPVNLVVHGYYSMNAVDILVWLVSFVLLAQVLRAPSPAGWLVLGTVLGLGLLNKISVLWLGAGLFAALVATPNRSVLRTPWPWLAGALAGLIFSPHIAWQLSHGWPTAEFVRVATTQKMVPVPPLDLFAQQILVWNPLVLPLWIWGAVALVRRPADDIGRVLAIVFATTAAILIANGTSRPNYLALAMPPLVAAGAVAFEAAVGRRRLQWPMPMATGLVAVVALVASPLTLPILSPEGVLEMGRSIGIGAPKMENREVGELDPHFADMFGWNEIVDTVAEVYDSLPAEDRERAAILALSFGEAGALDRFGAARGLPGSISPHNNYWLWGPGEADGSVVVIAGGPLALWAPHWDSIAEVKEWDCGYCLPDRNHGKVYIARHPRSSMGEIWRALRRYD